MVGTLRAEDSSFTHEKRSFGLSPSGYAIGGTWFESRRWLQSEAGNIGLGDKDDGLWMVIGSPDSN